MGTRNLTAVFADGEYKIAQYGQWDGYPEGQGKTALEFARGALCIEAGRQDFRGQLRNVRFITSDDWKAMWASVGVHGDNCTTAQSYEFRNKYPYFSRDHGASILDMVMNASEEVLLKNEIDFAGNSLFCEYAYVIDLDKNTFEAYEGFNKTPPNPGERFAHMPPDDGYYPVKLVASWGLDELPSDEEFYAAFDEECDE